MKTKTMRGILLSGMILMSLVGCSKEDSNQVASPTSDNITTQVETETSTPSILSATKLTLGESYEIPDFGTFKLFKVEATEKIESPFGNWYYENQNAGEIYVDVVLDFVYEGTSDLRAEDFAISTATNSTGQQYTHSICFLESGDSLGTYDNITPLGNSRMHCTVSVPTSEESLEVVLDINGNLFSVDYTMNEKIANVQVLSSGDIVEVEDFASFTFDGISYTDKLLPPNTSGSYSYVECNDVNNTYLVVKYTITNLQTSASEGDSFVGITAKYMDKYNYTGFMKVEDSDGKGFSSYENIDPLNTRSCYYLIEVPKTVTENPVELTISFSGKEYSFVG